MDKESFMTGVKIKAVSPIAKALPPPTEAQEQRALIRWIKLQPKIKDFIVKLNNEGKRTEGQGWNLKLMGMCVGASDLFLAYPMGKYAGLWLEVKRNKRYTLSERSTSTWIEQEKFQQRMKSVGFYAETCYGWQDGAKIIESYLSSADEK
jgi:hypothetical protein